MATLQVRVGDLSTRIATETKSLRVLINNNAANLSGLNTTAKTNLVAALNELKSDLDDLAASSGAQINDASSSSTTETYSINKIIDLVGTSISALTTGAPTALNTLDELAAALGDDANFAATITTALGNRVRVDTASQGLSDTQKGNARTNIAAYGPAELGDPDTNFVTTFESGLV